MTKNAKLLGINYYISKCQILVDYNNDKPPHVDATQEMIDELVEEGFLDKNGLTDKGIQAAEIIEICFELSNELMELFSTKK